MSKLIESSPSDPVWLYVILRGGGCATYPATRDEASQSIRQWWSFNEERPAAGSGMVALNYKYNPGRDAADGGEETWAGLAYSLPDVVCMYLRDAEPDPLRREQERMAKVLADLAEVEQRQRREQDKWKDEEQE